MPRKSLRPSCPNYDNISNFTAKVTKITANLLNLFNQIYHKITKLDIIFFFFFDCPFEGILYIVASASSHDNYSPLCLSFLCTERINASLKSIGASIRNFYRKHFLIINCKISFILVVFARFSFRSSFKIICCSIHVY